MAGPQVLGLDLGGSSSRARLSEGGRVVAEAEGPGANVATVPPRLVGGRLRALIGRLGPIHPNACCAGAAGAEVPAGALLLIRLLRRVLPGCRIQVVHDARLVLSAAELNEGIALIAGTGSVAYGRSGAGQEARAGGWGWLVGDDGSGASIAREAAREVMRRHDAQEPIGVLGESLLTACKVSAFEDLTGKLHAMREPMEWAALAPVVFASAGRDLGADAIIDRASTGLSELVRTVRRSLGIEGPVVLAGGLLVNQPRLEGHVRDELCGDCVRLDAPPVAGAVRLAEALLSP